MGDRLATTDMDRKVEGAVPLMGEAGSHVIRCGLQGRGLPLYQVACILIHTAVWLQLQARLKIGDSTTWR